MATKTRATKLNDVQLHLLKLFSKVPNKELPKLKSILLNYVNEFLQEELDQLWEAKGMSQQKIDEKLAEHPKRTPYPKKNK